MKTKLLLVLFLFTIFYVNSQTGVIQDTIISGPLCKVPQQSDNLNQLDFIKSLDVSTNLPLQVKIYIHIPVVHYNLKEKSCSLTH